MSSGERLIVADNNLAHSTAADKAHGSRLIDYINGRPDKQLLAQGIDSASSPTVNTAHPKHFVLNDTLLADAPVDVQVQKQRVLKGNLVEEAPIDAQAEKDRLMQQVEKDQGYGKEGTAKYDNIDPDAGDEQLQIAWREWIQQFLNCVRDFHGKIINSPANTTVVEENLSGRRIGSRFRPGLEVEFGVNISKDHKIVEFKIMKSSGDPEYDKTVQDAVMTLDKSALLAFPRGSQKENEVFCVRYSLVDGNNKQEDPVVPEEYEYVRRPKHKD